MSQKLFYFVLFSFLGISFQLDCYDFNDETCGDHNTKYNIKCLLFSGDSKCTEIEYDDDCTMTNERTCKAKDAETKSYQCYFLQTSDKIKCEKLSVDQYCHFDNYKNCAKRSGVDLEANHKCKLNDNGECKSIEYECFDYDSNCNQHGNTCYKVRDNSKCQIVEVNGKCKIDDNGDCVGKESGGPSDYEECGYNSYKTECKPINKACNNMDKDKCSQCKEITSGYSCVKVGDSCKEIEIDSSCKINNDGQCVKVSEETNNNICQFENLNTKCTFYEANSQCTLSSGTPVSCTDGATLQDKDNKKCDLIVKSNTKNSCEPRDKKCYEYIDPTLCEAVKSGTKKCSMSGGICEEYIIDNYCTVDGGACGSAADNLGENHECLFGINDELKSCLRKPKVCESYYSGCDTYDNTTHQCIEFESNDYCLPLAIDNNCHYSSGSCVKKDSVTIDENKMCYIEYDNLYKPKSCKIRDKVCSDYSSGSSTCNSHQKCYYSGGNCYETEEDNYCVVTNGGCQKRDNVNLNEDYEKCFIHQISANKYKCEKVQKDCSEITDQTKCNAVPEKDGKKCYYKSLTCKTLYLDEKCTMNQEGKCVENGSGKLTKYEICDIYENIYNNYIDCLTREKLCSDYNDNECGGFTPQIKLCYKIDGSCEEVKVDEQCSMNEKNECTGDSCHFDDTENNYRCYYQKNDNGSKGSLLNISHIILLILFFVF